MGLTAGLTALGIFIIGGSEQAYWDWQLTHPYDLDINVKVLALDKDDHDRDTIMALRDRGVKPVCYVSVGSWEEYRDDKDSFPEEVLGKPLGDWPDERYVDIRDDRVMKIMQARLQDCADRGFMAAELDNMDVFENESGFDIGQEAALTYVKNLAAYAHLLGLEVAQKNAPQLVPALVGTMDFIMVEECYAYDFCDDLKPYTEAGKDVLAIEYDDADLDWDAICEDSKARGMKLLLKSHEITAGGKSCN
ncbi:endo alpha-1,4 polygalactosaminidase [Vannielia litorea]|uniref:endo alpha-1,4 polygalactosaminidase n=1 Tax=Vannielia litorea TaxID=1217970 RepID=UPI001C9598EE|nr:endo alpha-1,4 polygalactosaminidase [Vannielia litorea]MBY6046502.1 endo alpha-1,4 polygalactosaminidase [Vannielia litorea]MBY6073915.1 endo alpha-1,4 polygalactosaminidase [Vannielia litorea]